MNLFVCHSQAHLILAVGLAKGRFINEKNSLILFVDFAISDNMSAILNDVFDKVLLRVGIYPEINKRWSAKIKSYPKDLRALDQFIDDSYNKVFVVCDGNIQEIYILKRVFSYNNNVEMIWLEDGAYPYYVNTLHKDGLNSNILTRHLRKYFFKTIYNLGKFYDFEGDYMSSNRNLTAAYLTIKGQEREIFKNKSIFLITKEEYKIGISNLFNNSDISLKNNAIILVVDKLDTYKFKQQVIDVLCKLVCYANTKGIKIYFKYHPREENFLKALNGLEELDKKIAVEYYLNASLDKNITIIGIKSTGLQSAVSLGFKTISLINLTREVDVAILDFFSRIGIATPSSFETIQSFIDRNRN